MANNTIYGFRVDNRQGMRRPGRPVGKEEEKQDTRPVEAICCRACGKAVTDRDKKIAVQGSHSHTFFNPAGIVFELGCFSAAPGCNITGDATSDFTWFAGYVWSFALCGGCSCHLGWFFEKGEHSFFGLILTKLKE
ncbi:MAG: cereblon family protein [Desulforhopalus sp.]